MAQVAQREARPPALTTSGAVASRSEARQRLRLEQVEGGEDREVAGQVGRPGGHAGGELAQDPLLLLGGHGVRDGELVAHLDHAVGLDEEGLPGLGGVVDDARHGGAGARQHRQHVALVSDGEVPVAQVPGDRLVPEHRLDPDLHGPVQAAGPVAQPGQLRAGPLRDRPGGLDGRLDPVGQPLRVGERAGERPEAGQVGLRGARGRPGCAPPIGPATRRREARAARGRRPWPPARAPGRARPGPRWAARSGTRRGCAPPPAGAAPPRPRPVSRGRGGPPPAPCRPPSGSALPAPRGCAATRAPRGCAGGRSPRLRGGPLQPGEQPGHDEAARDAAGERHGHRRRGCVEPDPGEQPLGEQPEAEEPGREAEDAAGSFPEARGRGPAGRWRRGRRRSPGRAPPGRPCPGWPRACSR